MSAGRGIYTDREILNCGPVNEDRRSGITPHKPVPHFPTDHLGVEPAFFVDRNGELARLGLPRLPAVRGRHEAVVVTETGHGSVLGQHVEGLEFPSVPL
jgi:hypothetical protein